MCSGSFRVLITKVSACYFSTQNFSASSSFNRLNSPSKWQPWAWAYCSDFVTFLTMSQCHIYRQLILKRGSCTWPTLLYRTYSSDYCNFMTSKRIQIFSGFCSHRLYRCFQLLSGSQAPQVASCETIIRTERKRKSRATPPPPCILNQGECGFREVILWKNNKNPVLTTFFGREHFDWKTPHFMTLLVQKGRLRQTLNV